MTTSDSVEEVREEDRRAEQNDKCPECSGDGFIFGFTSPLGPEERDCCPTCHGTGEKNKVECAFEDWGDTTLPHPVCHSCKSLFHLLPGAIHFYLDIFGGYRMSTKITSILVDCKSLLKDNL